MLYLLFLWWPLFGDSTLKLVTKLVTMMSQYDSDVIAIRRLHWNLSWSIVTLWMATKWYRGVVIWRQSDEHHLETPLCYLWSMPYKKAPADTIVMSLGVSSESNWHEDFIPESWNGHTRFTMWPHCNVLWWFLTNKHSL